MDIQLFTGDKEHKYTEYNSAETINWYPIVEAGSEANKSPIALFPEPGLVEHVDCGGNSVRAIKTISTRTAYRCFAVVDTTLYEIFADGTATSRGSLSNFATGTSCPVAMVVNTAGEMLIADPLAAYQYVLSTDTLTAVSDVDYVPSSVALAMDGYVFTVGNKNAASADQGRVHFSDVENADSWIGNAISPSFRADNAVALATVRDDLIVLSTETITPYRNDGTSPFSEIGGGTSIIGTRAPYSVCTFKEGVIFLGSTEYGEAAVYMIGPDYSVEQISTPAITWQLNHNQIDITDAEGFVRYSKDGQIFYYLTIPALETTYVLNLYSKFWHQRRSTRPYADSTGTKPQTMFRGRCIANFAGRILYGDRFSGRILREDYTTFTEDGEVMLRQCTSNVYSEELKLISVSSLELDCTKGIGATTGQGNDPVLLLEVSRDGGRTYDNPLTLKLGELGNHTYRAAVFQLGAARNWTLRISLSDPVDLAIFKAVARGFVGSY